MTPARFLRLRRLLWFYFWLLIVEGVLRKWVLPGLSNPLLLLRDPVALLALLWGWPLLQKPPWRGWLQPLLLIGALAFVLAITYGHGDIPTAAYGARVLVLQLPLIFLFAAAFNQQDVIRFSWVLAWLSLPMTVLIVLQSNLPSSHILNVAPGGEGSAVFGGVLERFRPPGVFSFINGVVSFYSLAAAALLVLLYGVTPNLRQRQFLVVVAVALAVAVPVSISRGLLAGYLQVLVALIAALALARIRLMPVLSGLVALGLAIGIATTLPAFQNTADAFSARWDAAATLESDGTTLLDQAAGVFSRRVVAELIQPVTNLESFEFTGSGVGISTNVGAKRLSGELTFLVGEGTWEASLNELGLPLGLAFLAWRVALGWWLLRLAVREAVQGSCPPLILAGASLLPLISGQTSQPTALGFLVVAVGLTLAACSTPSIPRSGPSVPLV